jgi:hypothetical protein
MSKSRPRSRKQSGSPNAIGAPTKYKPEYCQMLIDHMAKGLSFETFAAVVDVDRDTIYHWCELFPAFSDAKLMAKEKCQLFWETLGIVYVVNGKTRTLRNPDGSVMTDSAGNPVVVHGKEQLNGYVWGLNMRNRFGWGREEDDRSNVTVNLHGAIIKALHDKPTKEGK